MRYLTLTEPERSSYPVVLLVNTIQRDEIVKAYVAPYGVVPEDFLIIQSHHAIGKKKTPASEIKDWFNSELVPTLNDCSAQYLLVTDADYFKVLTKAAKVDPNLGYVMDCVLGPWKVVYVPNYKTVFYDPEKINAKIALGMKAIVTHRQASYQEPGKGIIHFAEYPDTPGAIEAWLEKLLTHPELTCDIETFSLKHHTAGIGTISFAWSQHEGIAFAVDLGTDSARVRLALKSFFERYTGTLVYHKIGFDVYVLIYQLFMEHILDTEGLLRGIEVLLRNWDCTRLIAYLALNSCAGNELGLKTLAQAFAGNYAVEEIKDIRRIPLPMLLTYNLVNALSTWYVRDRYYPVMVADQQLPVYQELFQPAQIDIIQMQLTGLPLNMKRTLEVKEVLEAIEAEAVLALKNSSVISYYEHILRQKHVNARNAKLKKKQITLADDEVGEVTFNPNSNPQLQDILYTILELPVVALTKSRQPASDGETLKALVNHTQDSEILTFLGALVDYKAVNKLTTSFIPAFLQAAEGPDGWHYLFGNFNLGGTVSGRLSSSDPNLQNLPANVAMALSEALTAKFGHLLGGFVKKGKLDLGKLIKSCFEAPPGWLFCGLDFDSLEDKISGLTTKDPNKLKVYTDGYDGHSLRALSYFGEDMPDIDPNSVVSINSIAEKYPVQRQDSKAPTFALTYQGTFSTLMKNCGFSLEKATMIETRYQELYAVSIAWVAAKLDQACIDGYITVAFGLRVRTPKLVQVVRGNSRTPREAEAEGRTAGNALGQSWCLLNSRAGSEFMGEVRKSVHRLSIRPSAQIHDAGYFIIRDDIDAIQFANDKLVKAVQWQEHPDIVHPLVKLSGKLGIFYPSWVSEITLPNGASAEEIQHAVQAHLDKTVAKAA